AAGRGEIQIMIESAARRADRAAGIEHADAAAGYQVERSRIVIVDPGHVAVEVEGDIPRGPERDDARADTVGRDDERSVRKGAEVADGANAAQARTVRVEIIDRSRAVIRRAIAESRVARGPYRHAGRAAA